MVLFPDAGQVVQGPLAAYQLDTDAGAELLAGEQLHQAHLSGGGHMGAAAGAGVRPGEGDDTHLAGEDLFAAVFQMFQLLRSRIGDGDGVVLPDVLVGPCLQLGHLFRGELHI